MEKAISTLEVVVAEAVAAVVGVTLASASGAQLEVAWIAPAATTLVARPLLAVESVARLDTAALVEVDGALHFSAASSLSSILSSCFSNK